jgi:protein-S-isoprenylcysteine O-methyltransferase Ste14
MSRTWPLLVYVGLVLALFIRFQDPSTVRRPLHLVAAPEHLRLVRRYHRVFYAILLAAPIEWLLRGRPDGWVLGLGAGLFFAGLIGYRKAGGALGEQLTPLVAPCEPAMLVEGGPYRRLRHPMYLAELAMAGGAPLTLGAYATLVLAGAFALVVGQRIVIEERLLSERLPGYRAYAERTYRLFPYVY